MVVHNDAMSVHNAVMSVHNAVMEKGTKQQVVEKPSSQEYEESRSRGVKKTRSREYDSVQLSNCLTVRPSNGLTVQPSHRNTGQLSDRNTVHETAVRYCVSSPVGNPGIPPRCLDPAVPGCLPIVWGSHRNTVRLSHCLTDIPSNCLTV